MTRRSALLTTILTVLLVVMPPGASAGSGAWSWPLDRHDVGAHFDKPDTAYGPGHRGIDLAGSAGDVVRAVAAGRVTFAGKVAGVAVVTVDHGAERSTYQPVSARVKVGDAVRAGEVIGTLLAGPSHCATACLHLGRLAGDEYLDPLELLGNAGRFQLISPNGAPPAPPAAGNGSLIRPAGGPITSPFGMRVHPVTGVRKLHDGTDFGVPCGTPVHAAATGTVTGVPTSSAYGRRIIVQHRPGFETSYNHLSSRSVSVGDHVSAGEIIARSGNTGLSTGCHLHFMVMKDGKPVDPMGYL
jgi:murein DD-endopeptidase MepM/ murein hydrolase activator NlpD